MNNIIKEILSSFWILIIAFIGSSLIFAIGFWPLIVFPLLIRFADYDKEYYWFTFLLLPWAVSLWCCYLFIFRDSDDDL